MVGGGLRLGRDGGEAPGYRLGPLLGQGGMASVFEAGRSWDGRRVALKTLHARSARDAGARRTMVNEALACAVLDHPSLVGVLDLDEDPELGLYLVAELVLGESLLGWLQQGGHLAEGLRVVAKVLDGLAEAHACGVVHGDLKPANILVTPAGDPKVCDFGIAQVTGPHKQRRSRRIAAGTPHYMAPEQFAEGADLDPRTDLYAVGILLHEMIGGSRLFAEATDHLQLLGAKLERLPLLERDARGHALPIELTRLVGSMVEPALHDRPRFAAHVARELRSCADRLGRAGETTTSIGDGDPTRIAPRTGPRTGKTGTVVLGAAATQDEPFGAIPEPPLPAGLASGRRVVSTHLPGTGFLHVRPPPLVGRSAEQAALREAIADVVRTGRSSVVVLEGPTGIGKSRLAAWAIAECERTGAMESTAVRFGAGGAVRSLRGAVTHLFAPASSDLDEATRSTASWLERGEGIGGLDVEALAAWLAAPVEEDLVDPSMSAALASAALVSLSRARPLALWFDDLPAARDGSLELSERFAAGEDAPILILATCPADLRDDPLRAARLAALRAAPRTRTISLGPLSTDDRAAIVATVAAVSRPLADRVAAAIVAPPLYFVQLVRDWVDRGLLELSDGELVARVPFEELLEARAPADVIASRVQALVRRGVDEARTLVLAALLAPHCTEEALHRVAGALALPKEKVELTVEEALLRGVLVADGSLYAFSHQLFRADLLRRADADPALATMATACAAELGPLGAKSPPVGAHVASLERRAGRPDVAYATLLGVADVMARGGDYEQAEREAGVGRRWMDADGLPADHPRRDELKYLEARIAYFRHEHDRARRLLRPLLPRFAARGDRDRAIAGEWLDANISYYQGEVADSERRLADLRARHGEAVGPGTIWFPRLLHAEAHCASFRGDHARAAALLAVATEHLERWPWGRWATLIERAEVAAALGQPLEAGRLLAQARTTSGPRDAYQLGLERETDFRIALARGRKRDRRVMEERARGHGHVWHRTACRLVLAAYDHTFRERTAIESSREALDAFARVPHDEAFSQWCMLRIENGLRTAGEHELADRARDLYEWRRST